LPDGKTRQLDRILAAAAIAIRNRTGRERDVRLDGAAKKTLGHQLSCTNDRLGHGRRASDAQLALVVPRPRSALKSKFCARSIPARITTNNRRNVKAA